MAAKTKVISRNGNTLKEKLYLPAIFSGMAVTWGHFKRNLKDTSNIKYTEYPEQLPEDITHRYRGRHRLTVKPDGNIKCTACYLCETICPADCIFIEAAETKKGEAEKAPRRFQIDLLECVYCGLCVEVCPHDAIRMDTGIFAITGDKREDFILEIKDMRSTPGTEDALLLKGRGEDGKSVGNEPPKPAKAKKDRK